MISVTPTALLNFLILRPQTAIYANCYTLTLSNGQVLYYTDRMASVTIPSGAGPLAGKTFVAIPTTAGPFMQRGSISCAIGGEIAEHDVTLMYDGTTLLNGASFQSQLTAGLFNLATYSLDVAVSAGPGQPWLGTINRFQGIVTDVTDIGAVSAKLQIKSNDYLLDVDWPRNTIMPQCLNTLFDAGCGLSKTSYRVAGACTAGSTVNNIQTSLGEAAGYFNLGTITFTSGVLSGLTYWIRQFAYGVVRTNYPMIAAPASGDTFTILPGCDRTQATCNGTYANIANFAGFPYVPQPETTY